MGRPRSATRRNWPEGLYQNTAGYFYYRDGDSGKTFGLGRDRAYALTEARAAFAKRVAAQSKSLLERISTSTVPSLLVWIEEWFERMPVGTPKSTLKNRRAGLREISARCGHLPVNEITPKMVADVLEFYTDAGKGRIAEVVRSTCSELFRAAEVRGHITIGKNPVAATKVKKIGVKRQRLTLEDFKAIHAATTKPWARVAMELALVTAQRRQDIAAMKREHVVDGHLQVDQGKSQGQTKLGIPTTLRLGAVGWSLQDVIKRAKTAVVSKYLVHHRTGGPTYKAGDKLTEDALSEAFAEARDAAAIKVEEGRTPPTFHEIRSLAIRLYKDEFGQEFAQILAGHRDMKTTLLYADPRDSESKRVMIPSPAAPSVLEKF